MNESLSPYMTYREVCQFTHRSLTTVKRMVEEGRLPRPVPNPVRPMFLRAEVQASAPQPNGHVPNAPAQTLREEVPADPIPKKSPGTTKRGRGRPRKDKGKTKRRAA